MAIQRDKIIASAEKLVAKGKIEPAIKEYERLLDDNPNDVNTLNRIGDLWVRINRNDEAVKVFGKIADHYSRDGFFLKAIAIYKKINKLDPSKLDIYARLADLYAKQGLAMEAKSQYQVLADYYLKHGDPGNALTIYRKISELDPNSINVHVKLADLYSQNNQTKEALKEYGRVGSMLLKRSMLDEAVQVFKKALKIDAGNIELVESLVTALLEAKDYENAIQIVQTSIETSSDDPRLLAIYGRILLTKGDLTAARAALERALSRDANDTGVRETLADLYIRVGNTDGALEMLTPLVEKAIGRGERGVAVEMLNRILRADSGHTLTLERLVAVY
nr:tetratricopeptide repeat protein [Acidobacteriota bacterium]